MSPSRIGISGSSPRSMRFRFNVVIVRLPCCLANQNGLCQRRALSRPPCERSACTTSRRLHRVYRKTTWPDDVANYIYKSGPAHLHGVTRLQFRIMIRSRVCARRIQCHRFNRLRIVAMADRDKPARILIQARRRSKSNRAIDDEPCNYRFPAAQPRPGPTRPVLHTQSPAP